MGIITMSFSLSDNTIAKLFAQGKAGMKHPVESTGNELYYHGNLIASWEEDGLYISNGGYVPRNGSTGSLSTKFLLNALPNVSISSLRRQWSLNGKEWDGEPIKVKGVKVPKIDTTGADKVITLREKWVKTDGWRGFGEPVNYVAGANDTGGWSDSPCPTDVATAELLKAKEVLKKEGIKFKETITQSSNAFCVHRYIVTSAHDRPRAVELLRPLKDETRLLYVA